jgi:hypothetical protein
MHNKYSSQIWYDQDSGTYRTNKENENIDIVCNKIGRPAHPLDPSLTGRYPYEHRIKLMKKAQPHLLDNELV